ncbi:hypothetical protein O6H91_09G047500 [Diphasiastrum complanatum]|nr:hypothetical protein O6H91_09G047500 [Diphasiastrum complanatum]
MDEKSLIKKYQKEIMKLKEELQQLKKGMIQRPSFSTTQEDLRTLRQQMEAGQVQLQSRLEEEEQAKEALMVRIQRLTKLILVSTKETIPYSTVERPSHRRRYSFGEEELAYLPEQKRGYNEDIATGPTEAKAELFTHEDGSKEERKTKKHGMLSWLKLRRPEKLQISSLNSVDHESSSNGSPADRSNNSIESNSEHKATKHKLKKSSDDFMPITEPYLETTQAGELFSASNRGRRLPPTGTTIVDQMDLLKEQIKMLSGEVALCTSALKRMTEQASNKPDDIELKAQIKKVKEEIRDKEHQIQILEQKIMDTKEIMTPRHSSIELSQMMSKLKNQLSERSFEVELKSADNRILQEQLQSKTVEIKNLQQTVSSLQSQLRAAVESKYFGNKKTNSFADSHRKANNTHELQEEFSDWLNTTDLSRELHFVEGGVMSKGFDSQVFSTRKREPYGNPQFLAQAATIEKLKQEKIRLEEEREGLKINTQKLSDEASYAKELASAAAVELKNLAEEVKKLSSQNSKLRSDLAAAQNLALWQTSSISLKDVSSKSNNHEHSVADSILTNQSDISLLEKNSFANGQVMSDASKIEMETRIQDLCQELRTRKESEVVLESLLTEKDHLLADLQKHVAESKHREMELESDLAGMWVLVAKLKSETGLEQTTVKPQEPLDRNTESRLGKGSAFDKYDNGSLRASQKNDSQLDGMEEMDVLLDDMKHAPYDRSDMMQHLHVAVAQSTGR